MPTATDDGRGLHLRLTLSSGSTASSAGGPTSFKRSLEELFGGAESDGEEERSRASTGGGGGMAVGGGRAGHGGGSSNGRNKRPRSESAEQPLQASALPSSSTSAANGRGLSLPPRLPTPRLESLDVHMSDIPLLDSSGGLEFSSPHRRRQHHHQQSSSSRSLPSPLPSTSASTSTSPQSSAFATTQQTNLTLSAIHNTTTSAHATTAAIPTLGLVPSSVSTSPSPISSPSLPLLSSSSSSSLSAPSSQSRSDRSSPPGLILPLPLSRSIQTPPASASIAGNLPLPSPTTSTGIISGTGAGAIINETEASPNTVTAVGVADLRRPEERFRATMQRYNVFENEIAVLRRSVSPPGSSRSLPVVGMGGQQQQQQQTASPPRLPPLELSDADEEEQGDQIQPLGPVRHGHVTSTSSAGSQRSLTSPALHLQDRGVQRNHLEPFFALPATSGIPPLPYDEDVDELDEEEDLSNHQHHQHQRVHGHSNRPVRAAVRDTPPRIELSTAVWSSLDIGSDTTPSTSARGVITNMTTNHDREENDDNENDSPEDDHSLNVYPRFRDHLDSALQALRSPSSPLVPGLVPGGIESSNTLTPVPNNDDQPPTTIILNDSESHPASHTSLVPPPATSSTLSSSSLAFSNNPVTPLRDLQPQSASNPASSSSLSGAVPVASTNMVRRFGRPPTLPPIVTEPTNLSSSTSSPRRGGGRYMPNSPMAPVSLPAPYRERDERSARIRRRISIDDDIDRNEDNEVGVQPTTNLRGTLQRSSNLGEVELPSPSLSEFYDWLGSPNSPDPDLLRDVVPMAREGGSVGGLSGLSREETREEGERGGRGSELERRVRRSWEEDVLSGFVDTSLGLDLNLRQRQREQQQQQQQQISLPPPPPPPVRPILERRRSVDSSVTGMDIDMESSDDSEARQRELDLERLPWTLGSSITSSTIRADQPSPQLNLHRETRRFTSSIPMSRSRERLRLYNDVEADDGWNPLHSTRHWHSESNPAAPTSPSISSLPAFSSSLFSSASSPASINPQSIAPHPSPPPPPPSSTAATSSGLRPRLPDFLLSHRGGRSHLFSPSRRSSSNAAAGVERGRERERRSSGESNDSLPPSLELNLGPSSHSVFGTNGSHASGTAGEGGQLEHLLELTPPSLSSPLTPLMRLFEPPTAVPPPSLGQQVPLLSSRLDFHHQNQRQRNSVEIEVLDDDDDDVEDAMDVIMNDDQERQPPEQPQDLSQRQWQQEREREQQHRYRPHTRIVGSDNSLVAENAAETRRLHARMDVARRPHYGSWNVSRRSSGRSWAPIVQEGESLRDVDDHEDLRNSTSHDEERGREESVGESTERQRRVRALASQIQQHRRQRPDVSGRQVRYEDFLSRRFTRHFPELPDGIGMPPRVTSSGGGGSTSSTTDRVSGPRIVPPPPRPRLHSIRHVPIPGDNTGSGNSRGDDDIGHGSSMSLSQSGDNRDDDTSPSATVANAPPHQLSSGGEWGTMFQLRPPGDHVNPVTTTLAHRPFITDSAARPSLDSVSSSDSSMTDSFTSSGASSSSASGSNVLPLHTPSRGMFLDTELPSPGLGGLFDTLVSNSTATTTGSHATTLSHSARSIAANLSSAPSSVIATAPTSEHYSSNSSSGFFSSTTGRFTPSPVRTSDGDLDEERVVADENARLQNLATRLGSMRDGMLSEMMNLWDRPEGGESEMRMDVSEGEQYGRAQNALRAPIMHRSSVGDFRRPGPFPLPPLAAAAPNTSTTSMVPSSSPSANTSSNPDRERRNHIIDPTLFSPGLFRNTVETLASGPREYAAQTSSSVPSSSSFAAVARPIPTTTTSASPPAMSSGPFPSQPTTSLPSPTPYLLAPEQLLRNTFVLRPPPRYQYHHHHGLSGGAQSPPVIPPLLFENDSSESAAVAATAGARARERSDVQEPLDSVANENEQMRQGYISLLRRQRRDGMARRGDESSIGEGDRPSNARFSTSAAHPSLLSSSSPSSSSPPTPFERRQLSWSQLERLLERSPERFEYHTSPGSSSRAVENRFRSNMEAMRPAIERQRRMRQEAVDERRIAERHWDVLRWRNDHNNPRPSINNGGSRGDAPTRDMATADLPNNSGTIPNLTHDRVRRAREIHSQNDDGATTTGGNSEHTRSHSRRWYDVIHNNLRSVYAEEELDDSDEDLELESFTLQRRYRDQPSPNFGPRMPLPRLESRLQGALERERENSTTRHRPHPSSGPVGWIPPQGYERVGPRPRNVAVGGGQDTSRASGSGGGGASTAAGALNDFGRPSRLRERAMHRLRASAMAGSSNGLGGNGVPGMMRFRFGRRFGDLGDYMNDDEFDASYESLLSLQEALGDVRPKSTPEAVLKKLKTGKYKEWVEHGGEIRCPICLEDYDPEDVLLRSGNCKHWMHKACLEQWFKGANTCPVCRTEVEPRSHSRFRCSRHMVPPRRNPGSGSRHAGSGGGGGSGSGNAGGSGSGSGSGSTSDPGLDPGSDPSGSGPNGSNSGSGSGSSSTGGGGEFW